MKKKVLAVLLSFVMAAAALTGCGDSNAGASGTTAGADSKKESQDTSSQAQAGDPEKVVMAFLAFNTPSAENEAAVEEAMNEILREKIGVEVDLLIMDAASYGQQIPLMISGGEKLDIFSALSIGFPTCVNNEYALDLEKDDLLKTYGQGIIDTMGDYLDGCRVNGTLYGLPQNRDLASPQGWMIVNEYLDAIGYEYNPDEINKITEEELEDIFARLHEKFPEKDVIVTQPVARTAVFCDYPGGDWYGVLMDPENSLELTDLFSSDAYKEYCNKFYRWNKAGYISADALTDTNGSTMAVSSGKGMTYQCGLKAGIILQESTSNGRAISAFQTDDKYIMASGTVANMPWCVNVNTEVPVAAMKLLNEFYTNAELTDILHYGIEGSDYVVDAEGFYDYPEGKDASNTYHPNVNAFMFNEFIAGVWKGDTADVWEQTAQMNNNASKSLAMGFTFDNSSVSAEYTALNNIYEEYRYQLEYGFLDPKTGIPEMVNRMESSGLSAYIAEKQKQLDEWAAK